MWQNDDEPNKSHMTFETRIHTYLNTCSFKYLDYGKLKTTINTLT